ncbi:MAG: NAD(P)H-dependent oxidoreductase [Alphaproteobacteria bacterium]|nr:NAD(P)H-dependent oxidoreductase [Alphaproteobacteria bacterium]
MRILVVYAHPVDTSFGAAIFREVRTALDRRGHEVRVLDLYQMGFDPVLTRDERLAYETPGTHREVLDEHIGAIQWAEGLIFVYPTWWYGLPAILKGWLDRVWLPEVSFALPKDDGPIRPLMQNIRLLGGVSTYGAGWWWTRYVGDPGRRTIMRGMRSICARNCQSFWLALHKMDSATEEARRAFLERVAHRLERL